LKKPTKAIIAAAGYGGRWLPLTKAIDKSMVPVGSRPMIDWVIQDCIKAGVKEINLIVNKNYKQIQDYYSDAPDIIKYLKSVGKDNLVDLVSTKNKDVKIRYIVQAEHSDIYGTAIPVWVSREYINKNDSFIYVASDDFVYHKDGRSEFSGAIDEFVSQKADALVMGYRVSKDQIERYGVFKYREVGESKIFEAMVEKPKMEEAPSLLANISKYILPGTIFNEMEKYLHLPSNNKAGEYYINDAINMISKKGNVLLHEVSGSYLDAGSPDNWLAANNIVAETK